MKKIIIPAAAVLAAAAVLFSACGNKPAPETSAAPAQTSAAPETTETESTEPESTAEEFRGVIVDGTMHTILVQTEEGELLEIHHQTDDGTDPDMTGLKEGILIGKGVLVTGQRGKDGEFTAEKLEDAGTACEDPDAMEAAIGVFFSFRAKNIESLADRISYPVTVEKDVELTSEDELKERYPGEKLFTEELSRAVAGTDFTKLSPEAGTMVLPGTEGPHIVMSLTDDGWAVTEIVP